MKRLKMIVLFICSLWVFTSCTQNTNYKKITAKEAYDLINGQTELIILDVRTREEHLSERIENSLLIPLSDIDDMAESVLKDKDTMILVYCRSGNRSKTAANKLIKLGFTNVLDFGGINDWKYAKVQG